MSLFKKNISRKPEGFTLNSNSKYLLISQQDFYDLFTTGDGGCFGFWAKQEAGEVGYILNARKPTSNNFIQISSLTNYDGVLCYVGGASVNVIGISPLKWNHYAVSSEIINSTTIKFSILINGLVVIQRIFSTIDLLFDRRDGLGLVEVNEIFTEGTIFPSYCSYSDVIAIDTSLDLKEIRGIIKTRNINDFRNDIILHLITDETEVIQEYNFFRKSNSNNAFDAEFNSVERFDSGILTIESYTPANTIIGISNVNSGINFNTVDYSYNLFSNRLRIYENGTNRLDESNYPYQKERFYIEKSSTEVKYYKNNNSLYRTVADTTDKIIDVKVFQRKVGEFISLDNQKITPTNITNVEFFENRIKDFSRNYNNKPKIKTVLIQ